MNCNRRLNPLGSLNPLGEKGIKLEDREKALEILTTTLEDPSPESGKLLREQLAGT